MITIFQLSDGVQPQTEPNIGLEEIVGVHIGESKDFSKLLEELTIWELKVNVHGLFQKILGLMT